MLKYSSKPSVVNQKCSELLQPFLWWRCSLFLSTVSDVWWGFPPTNAAHWQLHGFHMTVQLFDCLVKIHWWWQRCQWSTEKYNNKNIFKQGDCSNTTTEKCFKKHVFRRRKRSWGASEAWGRSDCAGGQSTPRTSGTFTFYLFIWFYSMLLLQVVERAQNTLHVPFHYLELRGLLS